MPGENNNNPAQNEPGTGQAPAPGGDSITGNPVADRLIRELRSENARIRTSKAALQSELDAQKQQVATLSQQISAYPQQVEQLKQQAATLQQSNAELSNQVSQFQTQFKARNTSGHVESELQRLGVTIADPKRRQVIVNHIQSSAGDAIKVADDFSVTGDLSAAIGEAAGVFMFEVPQAERGQTGAATQHAAPPSQQGGGGQTATPQQQLNLDGSAAPQVGGPVLARQQSAIMAALLGNSMPGSVPSQQPTDHRSQFKAAIESAAAGMFVPDGSGSGG